MASVIFLRAVNVGGANRCRPALIAKQLAKFGVVNIGAVGTFVAPKRQPPLAAPSLPLSLPSGNDWLVKIIAIRGRFVLGIYRRQMKTIGSLGKIEKCLGVPVTTRSWSTIEKVAQVLGQDSQDSAGSTGQVAGLV